MKNCLILFILLVSCTPEENPDLSYQERETVEVLDRELVEVQYQRHPEYQDIWFLVLKRENAAPEEFLTLVDTMVLSEFVHEFGRGYDFPTFTGNLDWYLGNFQSGSNYLKLLVSGQIKKSSSKDTLPGPPFLLEKIEQTPPCPVIIAPKEIDSPIQNTLWTWIGFVDEAGQVYSQPTCENPIGTIRFTQDIHYTGGSGYVNIQHPEAMSVQFSPGIYPFYLHNPRVYELADEHLILYGTDWYGPNRHQVYWGTTTKRAYEKFDSLQRLVSHGKVDFRVNGNRLILSRADVPIRALFMAH